MGQLQHPNVVKYRGTARSREGEGRGGEAFQIFIELAPSGSLLQLINDQGAH